MPETSLAETYQASLTGALTDIFGSPRVIPQGLSFRGIAVEFECQGPMLIVFLSTLGWMHRMTWEGAVHIDMRTDRPRHSRRGRQDHDGDRAPSHDLADTAAPKQRGSLPS